MRIDGATASHAIVVWTGYGQSSRPARDEDRLVAEFGLDLATELVPLVHRLDDDFYASHAHLTASDLSTIAQEASAAFRGLHPEISEEAVAALAWCYTYDYK